MRIVAPELMWFAGRFQPELQLEVLDDGTIGRIGRELGEPAETLVREAMLPGLVNAHSHAFQRGLRGKAERFGRGSGSFWSWREEMYRLANGLDAERFYRLTHLAFSEMLRGGITSVGEFHYLHHLGESRDYELDAVLVEAAKEAGIRMVVLDVCYLTGDVGEPLTAAQRRFGSESVKSFLESAERLESTLGERQSLGLVAHSIRAVPPDALVALHEAARARGAVFHMHVEEQTREIEACLSLHGARPLALLLDRLELGAEFTAVHCTHSDPFELAQFVEAGANVCVCPLTEANLADGIPPRLLAELPAHVALGSDSNLRIDFSEEMRLLEYAGRLSQERRGVFVAEDGGVAERLFQMATEGGARALGVKAGRLESGYAADWFTLDLDAPALAEVSREELLAAYVLGAGSDVVKRVAVGGVSLP